jgi:endonuclease/exonuclease/phosphatase (EEP) superfamily protein YafD
VLLLALVGESWWVTTVGLYLPRLVLALPLPFVAAAVWRVGSRRLLQVQGLALVVVLFPLLGLTVPTPGFTDRSAPRVRVLSYNINSGLGGVANLADEVDRYSPDVVLMQEVGETADLVQALKARYPTVEAWTQFLMATRYPLVAEIDPDKLPFEGRQRSPHYVAYTMETPLGRVAFYNVHPTSPRDALYSLRGDYGLRREIVSGHIFSGADAPKLQENAALRAFQVQAIAEAASRERGPTVVAGDTNLPGLSVIFRRNLSRFQDGFMKAGWGFGYTFPSEKKKRPWMRIDRILASDALRFVDFKVGTSSASDHRCVVADLQGR